MRRGTYLLPCDEKEKDRLDFMHHLFKLARKDGPNDAPTRARGYNTSQGLQGANDRCRVLDLGCGTGMWLLEMYEKDSNTEFRGVDLANMTPRDTYEHVSFRDTFDYESPWSFGEQSWNLIHLQMSFGSVYDYKPLYKKIVKHLRPGIGCFEQVEIDFEPRCDDSSLQSNGALRSWWYYIDQAFMAIHRPISCPPDVEGELLAAGFVDIHRETIRLPLNSWPRGEEEHKLGLWYNIAMSSGNNSNGGYGFEALSLAPLTKINEWNLADAHRCVADALREACDTNCRAYNLLHIWTARAPSRMPQR